MSEKISSEHWGPGLWNFLYAVSFNYSPENRTQTNNFLISLGEILPCEVCKNHYKIYLSEHPPKLESKESFKKWINDLHNKIRKDSSKNIITLEQIEELFFGKKVQTEQTKTKEITETTGNTIVTVETGITENPVNSVNSTETKKGASFSIQKTSPTSLPKGVNGTVIAKKGCNCGRKR